MRYGAKARRQHGMTLVEVAVSAGIRRHGPRSRRRADALVDEGLEHDVRAHVAHDPRRGRDDKVIRELQTATLNGEDVNANGLLGTGEDTNRNGRLDADWSLADGGIAATLTFNKLKDGWLWSDPITYSVTGANLVRTQSGVSRVICSGRAEPPVPAHRRRRGHRAHPDGEGPRRRDLDRAVKEEGQCSQLGSRRRVAARRSSPS